MQPGIAAADAKQKKKLSDLEESQQRKYATYAKADGLIQLDCAACHEPDAGGQYMRPIAFEQHCQACHPLQVRLAEVESPLDVPHGLTAERLTTVLDGLVFAAEQNRSGSTQPTPDESGRVPLIPGKTLGRTWHRKIGSDLLGRRTIAERTIAAKCQECHYARSDGGNKTELLDADAGGHPGDMAAARPLRS